MQLGEIGVTPAQSEVLRILAGHGPMALRELGEMLVCDTGASPSRIVDRLVGAGLVERTASEQDRRQVRLELTKTGRTKAERVAEIEDQLYDQLDRAAKGTDVEAFLDFLKNFTQESPAGRAFENRLAAEGRKTK
ncbi:MarR family transcriptional regulator [Amycolatopsis sp. NPDC051373]|uniref:MarR family winged helix-turn-helix transcriptional regulator n=1 Tax=Amycolatopsis sp. NPDC051373 TaxID=3155801 RepID=UPI00344FCA92